MLVYVLVGACLAVQSARSVNIVLGNDDGWAVHNVRAAFDALTTAGHNVVLSAPANQRSGSGSIDLPAVAVLEGCQFSSCPALSPAQGFNASNPKLNYVNSFPVTAVKYGLGTLAPKFFDGKKTDLVVTGPNVGSNVGLIAGQGSGTIGAAAEGLKEGFPAIAFSGVSGTSDSYTTLPNAFSGVYATLATSLVSTVLASGTPYLPSGVLLNVNYPAVDNGCTAPKLVLTRQTSANLLGTDVQICSYTNKRLPTESTVLDSAGCWASVTVLTASKVDASAALQEQVYKKLNTVLTCYTQA